jgi:cytochrome P450
MHEMPDAQVAALQSEGTAPPDPGSGSDYNPFAQPQMDDPYPVLCRARASEPVMFSQALNAWVVTRNGMVQDVLQNTTDFLSGGLEVKRDHPAQVQAILDELPQYVPMLPMVDAPQHTPRRRLTQGAVSPKRVSQLEGDIRATVNRLIVSFYNKGQCDFYRAFAYPYPLAVVSSLLGLPDDAAEKLHFWAGCRVALAWGEMDLQDAVAAARGCVDFHSYIEAEVRLRQKTPTDDVISDMLEINKAAKQPVSFAELVEEIQGIVVAGHETTANMITMTLHHLLSNPSDWSGILRDRSLIPQMIEESLRFDGPVAGLWRRAARDVVVGDITIPAGAAIFCSLGSANRDEAIFEDGERFKLQRPESRRHIMFGRGPHVCVGATLARLEARVAFEVLTERMPNMRLAQSGLSFAPNAVLRQPKALLIEWDV